VGAEVSSQFDFAPATSKQVRDSFTFAAKNRSYAYKGNELAQGLMGTLVNAELLAANAGVTHMIQLPDGTRGIMEIGAARDNIDQAPESIRTLYLAAHGAVREVNQRAVPRQQGTPWGLANALPTTGLPQIEVVPVFFPIIPVIVALTVVGVAGVVATAWYATSTKNTETQVQGDSLQKTIAADRALEVAKGMIAAGQPIPKDVWGVFGDVANGEHKAGIWDTVKPFAAGVAIGVVGLGGYAIYKTHHRGRR
jgi:hypothetical protein